MDAVEPVVATWLADDGEDAGWMAAIEEGLRRSADVPQRRRLLDQIASALSGRGARLMAMAAIAVGAVVVAVLLQNIPAWWQSSSPRVGDDPPPANAVDAFVAVRQPVPAGEPITAIEADGFVWLGNLFGDLIQVDALTGEIVGEQSIVAEGPNRNVCGSMESIFGDIWVPLCASGPSTADGATVWARVDPATARIGPVVEFSSGTGDQPAGLGDRVWVITDVATGVLQPIEPESGTLGDSVRVGTRVTHAAGAFGSLWLSAPGERAVLHYDPESGELGARVDVGGTPDRLLATAHGVWVALADAPRLAKIDPAGDRVTGIVPLSERAVQIAAVGSDIWVLTRSEMLRVDPQTFTVVDRLSVGVHAVSFDPQFSGSTYAMAVGSRTWFVPPRGEMIRIER